MTIDMKPLMAGAVASVLAAAPAPAATAVDSIGDYLGTYTGAQSADLDLVSASAIRNATGVTLTARVDGTIGTSPGALYVWGINRGAGTARLGFGVPPVGAGTLFDAVVVQFPNGTLRVATFPAMGAPTISVFPGALAVGAGSLSGHVPFALLPSRGFAVEDYTYALWSRNRVNPAVDGTNAEIADLLPGRGGFIAGVPEPLSWALFIAGFGVVGAAARRQRQRATA